MSAKRLALILGACALAILGCSPRSGAPKPLTLRVGYFPNITHAQALIGLHRGDFKEAVGSSVTIDAKAFNAGPSVIEALFAGEIDLSYIGPNPAINGYVRSRGEALRVVAGAVSGGAALVVRSDSGITSAASLAGRRIASPQLGNTQDVALRSFLREHGLAPVERGGTVTILPLDNPGILDLFRQSRIDGAWVPEPWASRLEIEGAGRLLVDERELWPNGQFTTAVVIVSTKLLSGHPDVVRAWLRAHVRITQWELTHPSEARALVNTEIKRITGKDLPPATLERAWSRMVPTYDPLTGTLQRSADSAFAAGFFKERPDLRGLVDVRPLNAVLAEENLPPVGD